MFIHTRHSNSGCDLNVPFLSRVANECFGIMCCFLKNKFSSCCEMTTEFALEQLERKSLTFAHTKSVLAFIKQVHYYRIVSVVQSKIHKTI